MLWVFARFAWRCRSVPDERCASPPRLSFDKGCTRNLREFMLAPAEARDRDVEYNDAVAVPLLEAELQALLSGGRGNTTVVPIAAETGANEHDAKHNH